MILKKIGVLSLARMLGGVYAVIGLVVGFILSLASLVGSFAASMASSEEAAGAAIGLLVGVGAIVFMPIMYGLMGFLGGALMAFMFNLTAGVFGGIEMTFVDSTPPPAAPSPVPAVQP